MPRNMERYRFHLARSFVVSLDDELVNISLMYEPTFSELVEI